MNPIKNFMIAALVLASTFVQAQEEESNDNYFFVGLSNGAYLARVNTAALNNLTGQYFSSSIDVGYAYVGDSDWELRLSSGLQLGRYLGNLSDGASQFSAEALTPAIPLNISFAVPLSSFSENSTSRWYLVSSVGASYYFEPDFTVTSRLEEFAINDLDGGLSFNSFFGVEFQIAQKFTFRAAVAGQTMSEDTEDNEFGLSYTGLQTAILYRF